MSRSPVVLRDATPDDAEHLLSLWGDFLHRSMSPLEEMELVVKRARASETDRVVLAEYDGAFAGAVYLRLEPRSPFDPELAVNVVFACVLPEFRRHGIGHALVEAGVQLAEQKGVGQVRSASTSTSRAAHRFLARLGLAPVAVLRAGPTHVVRAKLSPGAPRVGSRTALGTVLAQRRSQRRQESAD